MNLDFRPFSGSVRNMGHTFSQIARLFLAAALVCGGVITHAGSVTHATSSHPGATHEHVIPAEAKLVGLIAQNDLSKSDREAPSHGLGICLDAHCCTPAVSAASRYALLHPLESGGFGFAAASDYALSVAYSLLKPPREIA
jgi:hypothetical protein